MIFWRMVLGDLPIITRRRSPCIVLEGSPTHSPRRIVPYFYRHFNSIFSRTTGFVLKMIIFLIHGLGKCEGVGENSGHGLVI